MNDEISVGRKLADSGHRHAALEGATDLATSKAQMLADWKVLVADAEQLIGETAESSVEGFAALRARFESKLNGAQAQVRRATSAAADVTMRATGSAQAYVKENTWKCAGYSMLAGFFLGVFLISRKPPQDDDAR